MEGFQRRKNPDDAAKIISRRMFLAGAGAAGVAAALHLRSGGQESRDEQSPHEHAGQETEQVEHDLSFLSLEKKVPYAYRTGELEGHHFSSYLSDYSGIHGRVPHIAHIDFNYQMSHLWKTKLDRSRGKDGTYPRDLLETALWAVTGYDRADCEPSKSLEKYHALKSYYASAEKALREVRQHARLGRIREIPQFHHLTEDQMRILTVFERKITGRSLLAYSVTELMPTQGKDAPIGIDVYDFLLDHAGEAFIDRIPALGDKLVSVGPYQFTEQALYEKGHTKHGASLMNTICSVRQIPAKLTELSGDENHKAAYLFALYNLTHAVHRLPQHLALELQKHPSWMDDIDVTAFISAAHHAPSAAYRAFVAYADAYERSKRPHAKALHLRFEDFIRFASPAVGEYAKKSTTNYECLGDTLAS